MSAMKHMLAEVKELIDKYGEDDIRDCIAWWKDGGPTKPLHEFINCDQYVLIRRIAKCNDMNIELGTIVEPRSENPILRLFVSYGLNGMTKLIEEFRQWQKEQS